METTMKKILVIFGSPRKGNSYKITEKLHEELNNLGSYEFEYIFLDKVNLELCKGCHICLFIDEHKCPIKDDREKIHDKMLKADGIILVSPAYVFNVSGLMKNFIDRMCFLCHRPELFNQDIMIVSTVAAIGMNRVLKYLKDVAEVWGGKTITKLGVITPPNEEIFSKKNLKLIKKGAESYHVKFNKPFKPSFNQIINFEIQKAIFISKSGKSMSPADYKHFNKLKNDKFNIPVKVNPLKRFAAILLKRFILLVNK